MREREREINYSEKDKQEKAATPCSSLAALKQLYPSTETLFSKFNEIIINLAVTLDRGSGVFISQKKMRAVEERYVTYVSDDGDATSSSVTSREGQTLTMYVGVIHLSSGGFLSSLLASVFLHCVTFSVLFGCPFGSLLSFSLFIVLFYLE